MQTPVIIGKIVGSYGLQGGVKVFSYTRPRQQIFTYSPWWIHHQGQWQCHKIQSPRVAGKHLVVHLAGINQPEQVHHWLGEVIAIDHQQLPTTAQGEYYWSDLQGLRVIDQHGHCLGHVDHLLETGAHDVLVVKDDHQQRLIPFVVNHFIQAVYLDQGFLTVDWQD